MTANTTPSARRGDVRVQDQQVIVTQEPAPCVYKLDSGGARMPAGGGTAQVSITAMTGCMWTATSGDSWIQIAQGSGNGSGRIDLTVSANTGSARAGRLSIADQTFTVSQDAPPPVPTPTPPPPAPTPTPPSPAPTPTPPPPAPTPTPPPPAPTPAPPPPTPTPAPTPAPAPTPVGGQIEISGTVAGLSGTCPSLTFSAAGRTFVTNTNTTYKRGSCTGVSNGDKLNITGQPMSNGTVVALQIEFDK